MQKQSDAQGELPGSPLRFLTLARTSVRSHTPRILSRGTWRSRVIRVPFFIVNATKYALVVFLILCTRNAFAQSVDSDPAAIVELGAAASQSLTGGGASFGPDVAAEVTPIENWLEIEAGV